MRGEHLFQTCLVKGWAPPIDPPLFDPLRLWSLFSIDINTKSLRDHVGNEVVVFYWLDHLAR